MNKILISILASLLLLLFACKEESTGDIDIIYSATAVDDIDTIQLQAGLSSVLRICNQENTSDGSPSLKLMGFAVNQALKTSYEEHCIIATIDSTMIVQSGAYTIDLLVDDGYKTIAQLDVLPGTAIGKIESFIGPKTVNYGDHTGSMVTAFPVDEFHNATGDDLDTDFGISTGANSNVEQIRNKGTYSSLVIHKEKVSKVLVGAALDKGNTIEQTMRYLSGCPVSIDINLSELFPVADGRQFFKVDTDILYDPDNKIVANGTIVIFSLVDEQSSLVSKFTSFTVNGIASTWVKNPVYGGNYLLKASSCDEVLSEVPLTFRALITDFRYRWPASSTTVEIGPIVSDLGQYLPDGTPVTLFFGLNGGQNLESILYDGKATFDLNELWSDTTPKNGEAIVYDLSYPIKMSN